MTRAVLTEIGGDGLPRALVFNKCDRLEPGQEDALRELRPDAWFTAAHDASRLADLHGRIVGWFTERDPEFDLFVPWARAAVMGQVRARATVVTETYEEGGVRYRLRASADVFARLLEAAEG